MSRRKRRHKPKPVEVPLPRIPSPFELEYEQLKRMYLSGLLSPEYAKRAHDLLERIDEHLST